MNRMRSLIWLSIALIRTGFTWLARKGLVATAGFMVLSGCAYDPSVGGVISVDARRGVVVRAESPVLKLKGSDGPFRAQVQWTRQPAPGGAQHGLRIRLRYTGTYLLFVDANDDQGAPLRAWSIDRRTRYCSDDELIPNCEFREEVHVELPLELVQRAATDGLDIDLKSALGVVRKVSVPAAYVAKVSRHAR